MELIFVLYPSVEVLRIECVNMCHHLNEVSIYRLSRFHQILNFACKLLLSLALALFLFVDLCLLKHLLNLFFVLVPG